MKAALAAALIVATLSSACSSVDDERIPSAPVRIEFATIGEWQAYGVAGALDYRRFIKSEKQPEGFAYTAAETTRVWGGFGGSLIRPEATGFGGVLLVCSFDNNPLAYDLSCPVEINKNTRVYIDTEFNIARCPVCQSTFDVYRTGAPLSGIAADKGYALTRYRVAPGSGSLSYMLISH